MTHVLRSQVEFFLPTSTDSSDREGKGVSHAIQSGEKGATTSGSAVPSPSEPSRFEVHSLPASIW